MQKQNDTLRFVEIYQLRNEAGEAIEELAETLEIEGDVLFDEWDWDAHCEIEVTTWCSDNGYARDDFDWQYTIAKHNHYL